MRMTCGRCGCDFVMPDGLYEAAKCSPNISFWCPYGHQCHFPAGETNEERLSRELNNQKQQNARIEDEAREARAAALKAEWATKRLKKRVAAGVCPCCHRTVSQMARHMQAKHPGFVAGNVVKRHA